MLLWDKKRTRFQQTYWAIKHTSVDMVKVIPCGPFKAVWTKPEYVLELDKIIGCLTAEWPVQCSNFERNQLHSTAQLGSFLVGLAAENLCVNLTAYLSECRDAVFTDHLAVCNLAFGIHDGEKRYSHSCYSIEENIFC